MRYVFGEYQLDVESFRLTASGEVQHIEPQVFDVLRFLIEHRDRVVTKNELLDEVWGDRFVSESALTSRIKSARRAVGDHGTAQRVIRTVRGRGFQFIVDVDEIDHGGDPDGSGMRKVPARFAAVPRPPTPIIGRGREIEHVLGLLREARIVTLLGPGGVGKTRLAIEIAGRVADAFAGGVAYVELDHLVDAEQVPPLVAETLGVVGAPSDVGALAEAVGDQRMLLIVDNFEHVLDAAGFIGDLAAATDNCSFLVTSRERLRLTGEVCVDVPPFGVDDDNDALALFERTARSVAADALLDAAGRDVVVEICRAVDGLPLAIELAAAATRVVPPTMLLRRLHHTLGLAGADYTDRPDRHRTMRRTIDWSVNGLDPLLRELVSHISLFVAPVPLAAVASVWQRTEDETLAGLAALIDKSLVRPHPAPDDQAWFRTLVPIREYGIDLLEQSGDGAGARHRHANEIAHTLGELEDSRWASSDGHWIDVVRLRAGDVETAYRHARRTGDHALANRIAAPLYNYWHRVGHHDQARSWIDESLECDDATDPVTTAMLHLGAGYVTWVRGDLDRARHHWGLALDLWRNEGHHRYVAFCLAHLAGLAIGFDDRDEYARSMKLCDEAIAIARRTGERSLLTQCLNIAGELARVAGDRDVARDVYTEALDLLDGAHDHQQRAVVLSNLAALAGDTGEPDEAQRLGVEALRISADRHLWVTAAFCMTQLASAEYDLGRVERGARLLGAADEMLRHQRASRHSGDLPGYERLVERLRTDLNPDHLRELLDEGARLSIPEAIADALDDPVRRTS